MGVVISKPPATRPGFDIYWQFASKRHEIYLHRLAGLSGSSLTDDPVLAAHRFTNAYRSADRVSQYLIRRVQYAEDWSWIDTFARTLVFKIFNRIDIWEYLLRDIGEPDINLLFDREIDRSLSHIAAKRPLYSAAYIMPPPRSMDGPKYVRHLSLIRDMVNDGAHIEIRESDTMKDAYYVLRRYDSIGGFLAYQFITDLNYSQHLEFSEQEFVVPGPGALRGLRKCFTDNNQLSDRDMIEWTMERQHTAFTERGLAWEGLWGRDLQLIDIQNLFCEVDKYTRVTAPALSEFASGKRIKQRYRPDPNPITAWFPPKWGINDRIDPSYHSDHPLHQLNLFTSSTLPTEGEFAAV